MIMSSEEIRLNKAQGRVAELGFIRDDLTSAVAYIDAVLVEAHAERANAEAAYLQSRKTRGRKLLEKAKALRG